MKETLLQSKRDVNTPIGPSLTLRDMRPEEAGELVRAARMAFVHSPMEQIAIARPEHALVAEREGVFAGAMFLKVYSAGERRIGYLDVGFVTKAFRGQGVGRALYPAAVARLKEMGCSAIAALVINDNIPSWKNLKNMGFGAPTFGELAVALGWGPTVALWLRTLYCFACGTRLWLNEPAKQRSSLSDLWTFLWLNIALLLPGALLSSGGFTQSFSVFALAYGFTLLLRVLFGGLGCAVAKGPWRFSLPRGGGLLTLAFSTFGVFPMLGRWYPVAASATKEGQRAMGLQAAVEWAGMLFLFSMGAFFLKENGLLYQCATIAATLLVYRMIPFAPFASFGGRRVWVWNKGVFAALLALTFGLVFVLPSLL